MADSTKSKLYREAQLLGASFVANVIVCHQSRPTRKLAGLVALLRAGHTVTCINSIDDLWIDGGSKSGVPFTYSDLEQGLALLSEGGR